MRPKIRFVDGSIYTDKAVDTFGSRRAMQEWRMRMYLKNEFENLSEGLEPRDVCKLFEFVNEVGMVDQPREWIAQTIFDWASAEDTEWAEANAAAELCSVGRKFASPNGGPTKCGTEVWTHEDLNLQFDPNRYFIPANLNWKPQYLLLSHLLN